MKKLLLCVGDEQPLWQELRQATSQPGSTWAAQFACTGADATALASQTAFAAVVADVQLKDTSGLDLLEAFATRLPECARFILSEFADTNATLGCTGKTHRHLAKPCDLQTLMAALDQPTHWLPGPATNHLISQLKRLPSPPDLYLQVYEATSVHEPSIEKVGQIIAQDPAVAAKVLQLANSAVFGLQLKVNQPVEAVMYIGLEMTKSLVLVAHTFARFKDLRVPGFSVESLWTHSMDTARLARQLAFSETSSIELQDQSFTAGLLHDIGKLMLATNLPDDYQQALKLAQEDQVPPFDAEMVVFGSSHAEVAGHLLRIWGLPEPIVEAVALHHCPQLTANSEFSPLTSTHVANVLAHETAHATGGIPSSVIDQDYLRRLGMEDRLEGWRNGQFGGHLACA